VAAWRAGGVAVQQTQYLQAGAEVVDRLPPRTGRLERLGLAQQLAIGADQH
jgi:hypothetical protein